MRSFSPKQISLAEKAPVVFHIGASATLGVVVMGATDQGLRFIQFGETGQEVPSGPTDKKSTEVQRERFEQWMRTLEAHLNGEQTDLDLPLDIQGTAFQRKVWNYLHKIPYGELRSYTDVAEGIGQPKAVRAVAGACAANTLAIAIPCHRVIRGDGQLGGYRWGLPMKRLLIDRERQFNTIGAR